MKFIAFSGEMRIAIKSLEHTAQSQLGTISVEQLKKAKNGSTVKTSKDLELTLIEANTKDTYLSFKRGAQTIARKDCGAILAETLVGKKSICLDCGAGMGGLSTFLALYTKKVFSMDNREEHLSVAKENAQSLDLKNITFILHDITTGIPIKEKLDLITLDIRDPEKVVAHAKKALKLGGQFVAYCPQATQMQVVIEELKKENFQINCAKEVIEREWKSEGQILRPEHMGLMHTGFLVFARKISE